MVAKTRKSRRSVAKHGPDPIDVACGALIRQRRIQLGVSQQKLAEAIGLTFQQVQKYERGANRVSVSVLTRIAGALDCSPAELIGASATVGVSRDGHALALMRHYNRIKDERQRACVRTLAKALAENT